MKRIEVKIRGKGLEVLKSYSKRYKCVKKKIKIGGLKMFFKGLPKQEEIQHLIENDRVHWEQQRSGSKKSIR